MFASGYYSRTMVTIHFGKTLFMGNLGQSMGVKVCVLELGGRILKFRRWNKEINVVHHSCALFTTPNYCSHMYVTVHGCLCMLKCDLHELRVENESLAILRCA